ncbi:MAG TPA: CHAD domain-containing protein [Nevskia sp.]|nr:CHAD domain-containing protein [Nevskia sp.]
MKTPPLDAAALAGPAPGPAAHLARVQLEAVLIAALPLLAEGAGGARGEALHDFRVALRRLRSILRGWDGPLDGTLTPKQRRRLKKLSRRGGRVRDLELRIGALRQQRLRGAGPRRALERLTAQLDAEMARTQEQFVDRLRRHLGKAAGKLSRGLERLQADGTEPAASALGRAVSDYSQDLDQALAVVPQADEPRPPHRARIAAKRLRYLLEPLRGSVAGAASLLQRLAALQDGLGTLHDCQLLEACVGDAAAAQPDLGALQPRLRRATRRALHQARHLSRPANRRALRRDAAALLRRLGARS